jgi:hypothetical protein
MDIIKASAPHNHQHGCSAVLRLGKKATVIILLELSSHGITHHHPIFWISQENLTGITMCKSAFHISKLNRIVVNPFFLFSYFGNNREDAA